MINLHLVFKTPISYILEDEKVSFSFLSFNDDDDDDNDNDNDKRPTLRKKRITATNSIVLNQSMTKHFIRVFVSPWEHHQKLFTRLRANKDTTIAINNY